MVRVRSNRRTYNPTSHKSSKHSGSERELSLDSENVATRGIGQSHIQPVVPFWSDKKHAVGIWRPLYVVQRS